MKTPISCYIVGRGNAGQAVVRSLHLIREAYDNQSEPRPTFGTIRYLNRGELPSSLPREENTRWLFITNPHGLHTEYILEGERASFDRIFVEKPAAVNAEQWDALQRVQVPTTVFHGYRLLWGPQTLRAQINEGFFGEVLSLEGRYWQSSAAQAPSSNKSWKNDLKLSGEYDVLLDLGTHWIDLAAFLLAETPKVLDYTLSYANASAPHRDTHVQLWMEFSKANAYASVSKTVHGARNDLEVNVIGTDGFAEWKFSDLDTLVYGKGAERTVVPRTQSKLPLYGHSSFQGLAWLEGYLIHIEGALREGWGDTNFVKPSALREHLAYIKPIFFKG
jgi:predicted dehydrogenase